MLSKCFGVLAEVFFVVFLVLFLLSLRVVSADLSLFDFLSILILNIKRSYSCFSQSSKDDQLMRLCIKRVEIVIIAFGNVQNRRNLGSDCVGFPSFLGCCLS